VHVAEVALAHGCPERLIIASDTPTGTGVIPLALLRSMAELVSLGPLTPELAVAAVTGSVGAVYDLPAGVLEVGRPADLVVVDAPQGSQAHDWRGALRRGDLPAVAAAVTEGRCRFTRSRNTPPPKSAVGLVRGTPSPVPS
jgi:enamidase